MSCISCMNNKNNEYADEKFSSFLGGLFLTRKSITNFEFFKILDDFQNAYNTYLIDDDLIVRLNINDNSITLIDDYDDIVIFNNKRMKVRDYLYSMTSSNVRDYFHLEHVNKRILKINALIRKRI